VARRRETRESLATFFAVEAEEPAPQPQPQPAPAPEPVAVPAFTLTPHEAALIAETCARSAVLWLRTPDEDRFHGAWYIWHADAVHLVHGNGEQVLPLLDGEVEVIARSKETGARLVRFVALAEELLPAGSPEWEAAATALAAARLNARDAAGQRERWASGALIARLSPLRMLAGGPIEPRDDDPGRRTPVPTPATTNGRRPWHLGGRPQRRTRQTRP
jgi:hypothetical protein